MHRDTRVLALAALALTTLVAATEAANTNRRFVGRVVDEAGQPVAGVSVELSNVGGEPPVVRKDRDGLNANEAYSVHDTVPYSDDAPGGPIDEPRPLGGMLTDQGGKFTYVTHQFVGALWLDLSKAGYGSQAGRVGFPLGTTRKEFILAAEPEADAPDPRVEAAFARGAAALEAQRWESVRDAFAEVVELDPRVSRAWLNLAIAHYQLQEDEAAVRTGLAALDRAPELTIARSLVADALTRLGRADEAAQHRRWAAEETAVAARRSYNRGAALLGEGKAGSAMGSFRRALAADPDLAEAHYALGVCLVRANAATAARGHLERFLELAPDHAMAGKARSVLAKIDR